MGTVQYLPFSELAISNHESDSFISEKEPVHRAAFNNVEVFIATYKYGIIPLKDSFKFIIAKQSSIIEIEFPAQKIYMMIERSV